LYKGVFKYKGVYKGRVYRFSVLGCTVSAWKTLGVYRFSVENFSVGFHLIFTAGDLGLYSRFYKGFTAFMGVPFQRFD
jgi:hypothetical protein